MKNDVNNKFQSKADTLKFLQQKIKKGKIEEIVSFTVYEWQKERDVVIQKIIEKFYPNEIIIRSSAKGEDSIETTEAGKYQSIQKISTHTKKNIEKSVNTVIKTYEEKGNKNSENQVLVQKQTTGVITNGVAFTQTPENQSPYFVINFSDSKDTDNVTKGETSNLVKIFRKISRESIPQKWKKLISAIDEIEKNFSKKSLDIEFGITKKDVVIFQVRPLTTIQTKYQIPNIEKKVKSLINKNQKKYQKLKEKSSNTYFSDMTDWNPAEIIGNNPNPLDYSLYDFLIMKDAWQKGRKEIGYEKYHQGNLMEKFGNKPYVNIKKSFSSLIPDNLSPKLKKKLLRFYLKKLEKNHHLHDKVEFEILFSCFDFTFDDRKIELEKFGFKKNEINELKEILVKFTNDILLNFTEIKEKCMNDSKQMSKNRKEINNLVSKNMSDTKLILRNTKNLLEDCKNYGTINFSTIARVAFIGNILLKSLEEKGLVSKIFVNNLMSSIASPLAEIQMDLKLYDKGKISKKEFLKKYGHLRPGTYDITAERYNENQNFLENIKFLTKSNIKKRKTSEGINENILKKNKIQLTENELITFVKESIRLREIIKFEFTKNLSDALYLITKAGNNLGFSKKELSYLDIDDIFISQNLNDTKKSWQKKISKNKRTKEINEFLILPPMIFSKKDFEIINYNLSHPNFITSDKITSDIHKISNLESTNEDFSGKIIVIENADPGFDWIFTKNPAGLITKYGGVASHMAIRCAELGMPAAIGIGEIIFERIEKATKILLDCENQQIIVLENLRNDPDVEVKKILKSLGYIK